MTSRQETFYTARLPPITPEVANRRASVDSVSSAADRRRWRNHAHVLTPEPQTVEHDPFEELFGNQPPPATRRRSADEKTSDGSDVGEEGREEEVESQVLGQSQGVREGLVPGGDLNGNAIGLDDYATPSDGMKDDASVIAPRSQKPVALADDDRRHAKLPWRERIRHFTWTWFCLTMATGGLANVLYAVPFRFHGLYALGCVFFISNMVLFLFNVAMIRFLVSLMIYASFIYRLMTQKLPKESLRPGMFISVGPSGFTIAGIITMGQELPRVVPPDFMGEGNGELAGKVGMIMANFMGLWLWGLALWFFFISVGAHWSCARRGKMDFAMTWYSFVFPNTALTTATFAVARALNGNQTIRYVGCAMTIALILMWIFVVIMNVRAVVIHQILWPQKQEDRTEGGWKAQTADEQRRRVGDGGESAMGRIVRTVSRRGGEGGTGAAKPARAQTDAGQRRRAWSFVSNRTGRGA
ncbi:hypothetical protein G6514_000077 [Epicoccum nigrum]|nr:hypothetical protein G6514_000077 [Epicoccum nigrum]